MKKSTGQFVILFGLFLISVLVRYPNLNRPLSKHHEFCTAITLQILTSWHESGIDELHYNPGMNYQLPADKYINNWASSTKKMKDDKGNFYYVSHPPFAYYLPHFVFYFIGVSPSIWSIQLFNLCIHFLCAFFVFKIVDYLISQFHQANRIGIFPALVAFSVYLFSPATLWFHSNVYMSDMLVMLFFISASYFVIRMLKESKLSNYYLYACCLFLMVYTSWLGVFYAISALWIARKKRENLNKKLFFLLTIAATCFSLGLMIWQYSGINGLENYFGQMVNRFEERGSLVLSESIVSKIYEIALLIQNYFTGYFPFIVLILIYLIKTYKKRPAFKSELKTVFAFILLPVILLHATLLNYSGHDFVALYGALFLSVFIGIIFSDDYAVFKVAKIKQYSIISLCCMMGVLLYLAINLPGTHSWKGDAYNVHLIAGESIKKIAKQDEVVFIKGIVPEPQVIHYAHRNVQPVKNMEEAKLFLKKNNRQKGILFFANDKGEIRGHERFQE